MAHQTRFGPRLLYSTSIMARFTQFEFLRRIVCRIPQLNLRHSLQQHVLSLCLHHMAVFKMFVAEIKGSEQRAIRSCVLLQIARPQPPPEKKTETGTGIGVLALPGVWSAFLSLHVWGCAAFCSDHCPIVRLRAPHTWGLDKQILQKRELPGSVTRQHPLCPGQPQRPCITNTDQVRRQVVCMS